MVRRSTSLLTAALCLAAVAARSAAAADVRGDLSFAANPNGVWTYGSFDLASTAVLSSAAANAATLQSWHPDSDAYPYVGLTTITPDGFVSLHPGDAVGGAKPWATLAFTAPAAAVYRFAGEFRALDGAGAGTISDYVIRTPDSSALYAGGLRFYDGPASRVFAFARTLLAGQSVLFAVGDGRLAYPAAFNGSAFDNTGLRLAVDPLTPGDFNRDGKVDAADLARWRTDFGTSSISDADIDGDSDGTDFLYWQRNLGAGVGVVPIPEPAALGLAALAALILCRRARRQDAGS